MALMSDSSPIGSGLKMRASMRLRLAATRGRNAMSGKMSRSMSMPGAISISSSVPPTARNTARSVTKMAVRPSRSANAAL